MSTRDTNSSSGGGDDVAASLKRAFAEVMGADLSVEEKGRWHHRLLAITNMCKRDVARAREQLARFDEEWKVRMRGKDERV